MPHSLLYVFGNLAVRQNWGAKKLDDLNISQTFHTRPNPVCSVCLDDKPGKRTRLFSEGGDSEGPLPPTELGGSISALIDPSKVDPWARDRGTQLPSPPLMQQLPLDICQSTTQNDPVTCNISKTQSTNGPSLCLEIIPALALPEDRADIHLTSSQPPYKGPCWT